MDCVNNSFLFIYLLFSYFCVCSVIEIVNHAGFENHEGGYMNLFVSALFLSDPPWGETTNIGYLLKKTVSQLNIFMISQISHETLSVHRVSSAIFDVASVSSCNSKLLIAFAFLAPLRRLLFFYRNVCFLKDLSLK